MNKEYSRLKKTLLTHLRNYLETRSDECVGIELGMLICCIVALITTGITVLMLNILEISTATFIPMAAGIGFGV